MFLTDIPLHILAW